jgi:hypothetical protein
MMPQQGTRRERAGESRQGGAVILGAGLFGRFPSQADRAAVTVASARGIVTDQARAATMRDKHNYIIPVTPGTQRAAVAALGAAEIFGQLGRALYKAHAVEGVRPYGPGRSGRRPLRPRPGGSCRSSH